MRGETGRLTEAQRQLVADHWGWARGVAERYRRRHPGIDRDWEGAVAEALCRLALRYRPDRGVRFKNYSLPRLHGACLDALRNETGCRSRRYWDVPESVPFGALTPREGGPDDAPTRLAFEPEAGEYPVGWELESYEEVQRLSHRFPPRHAALIRSLYLHAGTALQRDAARLLGVVPERIEQMVAEIKEMARERAEDGTRREAKHEDA